MAKTTKPATATGAPEAKDTANTKSNREKLVKEVAKQLTDTNQEGQARAILYAIEEVLKGQNDA